MKSSLEQQEAFLKQFEELTDRVKGSSDQVTELTKYVKDLSDRAIKHWPMPDPLKEAEEDPGIGYKFVCVVDQTDRTRHKTLVNDFFEIYRERDHFFSGIQHQTIYWDEKAFKRQKAQILAQIPTRENLKEYANQPGNLPVCTFLILAHKAGEKRVQAGCVVLFFPASGTLLLESILIAKELQTAAETEVNGLSKESGNSEQTNKVNEETNKQKVLDWLLTFYNRQKGGGKSALITLVETLKDKDKIGVDLVRGVFHQILNPAFASNAESQQKAATNLTAFHSIKARYLKFAYYRPAPGLQFTQEADLRRARRYFLLTFPQVLMKDPGLGIDSALVLSFIIDYGKYLNPAYPNASYQNDLMACTRFSPGKRPRVDGFRKDSKNDPISLNSSSLYTNRLGKHFTALYFHNVPRLEQPRFFYRRASVGFEILVDEDYFEPIGIDPYHDMTPPQPEPTRLGRYWNIIRKEWGRKLSSKPDPLFCPVAHSGETDLFSYKYQSEPPYFTRYYIIRDQRVDIKFPSHFEFTSEGRMECFYQLPQTNKQEDELTGSLQRGAAIPRFTHTVRMKACVSYTYFLKSAVRVWHLVLKPDTNMSDISELDIVKLMRFFSGSQEFGNEEERRKQMREIEFSLPYPKNATQTEDENAADSWYSLLLDRFPLPFFRPDQSYKDPMEQNIQKGAWQLKTWGVGIFWVLLGAALIGIWGWKLPAWLDQIWQWSPTLYWEKTLYWALCLFILSKVWSWFFHGIEELGIDGFHFLKKKITRLFIRKEVDDEMPWLNKPDNLIQLLQDLTGVRYERIPDAKSGRLIEKADQAISLRNVRSGVVEIDTGDITPVVEGMDEKKETMLDAENFLGFREEMDSELTLAKKNEIREKVKELYKKLNDDEIPMSDEPEPFTADEYADYVFKAYCGICLGIFDYDRMGFQEIDDTLVPLPDSKTESSFMVIHRGVLAMLGYGDDVMDTFWDTLGINAYLLIPSAVLAHNDMVSRDAENRLNKLLNDLRTDKSRLTIPELIEHRNVIDDLLNDDILGDVFQYKTEQELYKEGMERRGIAERVKDARSKLEQMDKLISTKQEERTSEYQRRIQYIVTIVGAFSFYQIVHDFFVNELAKDVPEKIIDSAQKVRYTVEKPDKELHFKDIPDWFLGPIRWIDSAVSKIFRIDIFQEKATYDPLDLAHLAIKLIFIGLIVFLLFNIVFDPNKSRKYFWRRRNRHRTLFKTHAPLSKNRPSAAKRAAKR